LRELNSLLKLFSRPGVFHDLFTKLGNIFNRKRNANTGVRCSHQQITQLVIKQEVYRPANF
jgi:hypothetical protein